MSFIFTFAVSAYIIYIYVYLIALTTTMLFIFSVYQRNFSISSYANYYMAVHYFLFLVCINLQILAIANDISLYVPLDIRQGINNHSSYLAVLEINSNLLLFSTTTIEISFFTNVYIFFYMKNDLRILKFFLLLNYFVLSMVFLLHSSSFILLFFFWECIGIFSFFLINFYNQRPVTFKSAFKAFSFNRVSDVCLLIAMVIYWSSTNTFFINNEVFCNFIENDFSVDLFFTNTSCVRIFVFFLVTASFIKSAQIPFFFWLPDSMEAPVPASALIHSATLVSAGVYLFFKFDVLIFYANTDYILPICVLTMASSSLVASAQTDLKKMLAYSTISNCGLIFVSFFVSSDVITMSFFINHGWSKSISFMLVGCLVTYANHTQDLRSMGGIANRLLTQMSILFVTILTLASWFFTINSALKHSIFVNYKFSILGVSAMYLSTVFTYAYSCKLIYLVFYKQSSGFKYNAFVVSWCTSANLYIYMITMSLVNIIPNAVFFNSCNSVISNTLLYLIMVSNVLVFYILDKKNNKNYAYNIVCVVFIIFLI